MPNSDYTLEQFAQDKKILDKDLTCSKASFPLNRSVLFFKYLQSLISQLRFEATMTPIQEILKHFEDPEHSPDPRIQKLFHKMKGFSEQEKKQVWSIVQANITAIADSFSSMSTHHFPTKMLNRFTDCFAKM